MTNKLTILNSFVMPAEDETFEVTVSDTKSLAPNCWLWNESVGYLEVVKYSLYNNIITVKNLGRRENAKNGTEFPTCMEFLVTAPTALDPYNPLSTCLAADFNSPTVGQEAYMSVGSTYVLKVDDQIIVGGDYRYAVTQVVNATTLKVRNEGLGKEGIIEVGCGSCVPVQVVSKLNCCPIPSGDLTSNTSVLTVNTGYDVLLDNASLTLDTDLSKYDNSSSEFITLNDVPRGTLSSLSTLIGVTGGSNNVLGNITLSLDTDLSKYNNTTSGFITLGDVPRGTLSSNSSVLTVSWGVNNVLDNIELDLDTDLSKYDNTTSSFLAASDKKNLTSNTSVLTITNGTGSTLENASLSLDTDLSKYDNTTSSFISSSDKKNLISTSPILTVNNGTGAVLESVSLTLNTDLSQYDNSVSQFVTAGGLPSGYIISNTSVLSVSGGSGATLTNVSLTLDTDLSQYDNSTSDFATTSQIPTNVSQLNNDAGYITSASLPTVNNATLTIQKNSTDVGTFTANASSNVTVDISVPTDTNDLTNGAGYITNSALSSYLPLSGGIMTGNITVSGNHTLGNSTQEWNTVYTGQVNTNSNTLYVEGNSASVFYFLPTSTAATNYLGSLSSPWNEIFTNKVNFTATESIYAKTNFNDIGMFWEYSNSTYGVSGFHSLFIPNGDSTISLGANGFRWNTVWYTTLNPPSDIRLKENIEPLESGLKIVNYLDIKSFTFKKSPDHIEYGIIAQDVVEKYPELISVPDSEDGTYGTYLHNFIFASIRAIQELSSKVDELNAKIKVLEGKL